MATTATENKFIKLPIIKQLVFLLQKIKLPWLHGLSLFDLLDLYIVGIIEGTLSYRAAGIAWSFFMALFPFMLFIFNLIPFIPIKGFQEDFLGFVQQSVPPTTYDAIYKIINDILHNSHSGLLSTGFLIAILLMTNGINAILGGFETSHHMHIDLKRKFLRQYFVSLALSMILSLMLIFTVAAIIVFEVLWSLIRHRFRKESYKVPFLIIIVNRIISRLMGISVLLLAIGIFQKYAES